jgi:hypothetical protein
MGRYFLGAAIFKSGMQFVNERADVRKDILLFLQIIIQPKVNKMKKYLMAAALIGAIGFTSFSMANARGNYGYGSGPGYGDCGGAGYCNNAAYYDRDNKEATAFFEETKDTRKQIIVKQSELDALMRQDNPDEQKVGKLTGEIYDLEVIMTAKADKAFSDNPEYENGRGRGYGYCGGGRRGW